MSKKETRGRKKGEKSLTTMEKVKKFKEELEIIDKEYHFNYLLPAIDQKRIIENGWDLDIIDMAIFHQLKSFIDSGRAIKITDKHGDWFFVSESKIIQDLPCVPINSVNAVYKRIANLIKFGLIERNPTNYLTGKKYLRVTQYANEKLHYDKLNRKELLEK